MKHDKNTNLAAHMKTQEYDVCKVLRHVGVMDAPSLLADPAYLPHPSRSEWSGCLLLTTPGPRLLLPGTRAGGGGVTEPSRPTEWGSL